MKLLRAKNDERLVELADKIVNMSLASLFVDMPFLDTALFRLTFKSDEDGSVDTWATDGATVLYDARHVLSDYRARSTKVPHDIMHVVLHCVFRHMFVRDAVDQRLWNLACDMAVETLIVSLGFSGLLDGREAVRGAFVEAIADAGVAVTAERLYRKLRDERPDELDLAFMEELFYVDDHPWYAFQDKDDPDADDEDADSGEDGEAEAQADDASDGGGGQLGGEACPLKPVEGMQSEWEEAAQSVQTGLETLFGASRCADGSGELLQALRSVNRTPCDYRGFLRGFCSLGEAMQVNDDEFDYIYYTYGLDAYGDMPLIEPLEYKEISKLRDIAIVIDSSGSVAGESLQLLFERTYDLIMDENNAFRRFNIHLIQCDAHVTDDLCITSRDEFSEALERFEFKGLGGTDYVAAFEHVDALVAQGAFSNFKGVLYFTDGLGRFPARPPAYRCAFVLVEKEYVDVPMPPWAIKLLLTEQEVREL